MPTLAAAQTVPNVTPCVESYLAQLPAKGGTRLILGRADTEYRTRLREAARQRPNFAGHYVLAIWSACGSRDRRPIWTRHVAARRGLLLALRTSAAGHNAEPVRHRRDSRLLILNGLRNERAGVWSEHYYTIDRDSFVPLPDGPRQG